MQKKFLLIELALRFDVIFHKKKSELLFHQVASGVSAPVALKWKGYWKVSTFITRLFISSQWSHEETFSRLDTSYAWSAEISWTFFLLRYPQFLPVVWLYLWEKTNRCLESPGWDHLDILTLHWMTLGLSVLALTIPVSHISCLEWKR